MDVSKLQGALNKAKRINEQVDIMKPIVPNGYIPSMADSLRGEMNSGMFDASSLDVDMGYQNSYDGGTNNYNANTFTEASKKLPTEIFESLKSKPIVNSNPMFGSVLDNIMPNTNNMDYGEKELPAIDSRMQKLIEKTRQGNYQAPTQYQQQPQQYPQPQVSGAIIDYSLMRSMIKDIISEEMKVVRKQMLNESKQNANSGGEVIMQMGGSDIKFITKNGNIYQGSLKLVGNLNQK